MDNDRTKLQGWDALQRVFPVPPPCLPVQQQPNDCGKCHKAYSKCGELPSYAISPLWWGLLFWLHCKLTQRNMTCCSFMLQSAGSRCHRPVQGSHKDTRKKKGGESVGYLRLRQRWSWAESQCLCLYGLDALSGEKGWACEKELQVIQASKSLGVWVSEHH